MPRSIWTGAISFGLVNVPVRMYSAVSAHTLHFHYLHKKDNSRIGYEKVCKEEGKRVPDDEIVKGFEYEKGEWVYMTEEDFDEAKVEGYKTIDIRDFVPYEDVDPIYFRKTYYLGPQEGGERVYSLLLRAMEDSGLAAIAKYIARDRQYLGCLRVRDGILTLEQMYFADEIRPIDEIKPERTDVPKRELEMAMQLIENFGGTFDPEQYKDTYRDTLCEIIEAKRKGEEVHVAHPVEPAAVPDLMEALRASVDRVSRKGGKRVAGSNGGDRLGDLTKEELYERAKEADIAGRSKMDRDELIAALKAA